MATLPPFADPGQYSTLVPGEVPARTESDLKAASAVIRRWCKWHVWPVLEGQVLTIDGPGGRTLMLPTMNLRAVTACTEDGQAVDVSRLRWSASGWVRKPAGEVWSAEPRSITITINHGHDSVDDIAGLCVDVAARAAASPAGVVRKSMGDRSVTYSQNGFNVAGGIALLDFERDKLEGYRLR